MRLGTRSAHAHASGGDQLEDDRRRHRAARSASGTPGSGPNGSPVVRDSAHTSDEGQAAGDADGEHPVGADPAEQNRPAELHLGAEHEEEPEAPPLGEVLGRDGEVHERGACGRDRRDHERQRQSAAEADEPDQHGRRNRGAWTPGLET